MYITNKADSGILKAYASLKHQELNGLGQCLQGYCMNLDLTLLKKYQ